MGYILKKQQIHDQNQLSWLIAWACVFQMLEWMLPTPLPGVRLGLANIMTLLALLQFGLPGALITAVVRVVLSGLLLGTFLTPTFILSFSAALLSALTMGAVGYLQQRKIINCSIWGVSLVGAVCHNLTQLGLVYMLFIHQQALLNLTPWLIISGLLMGSITAYVSAIFLKVGHNKTVNFSALHFRLNRYQKGQSNNNVNSFSSGLLSRLPIKIKLLLSFGIILIALVSRWEILLMLYLILTVLALTNKVNLTAWLKPVWRLKGFILISMILEFIGRDGSYTFFFSHWLSFILRLAVIVSISTLLMKTSKSEEVIRAMSFFSVGMSRIMLRAWYLIPSLLEYSLVFFKKYPWKTFRSKDISMMLAQLYASADNAVLPD